MQFGREVRRRREALGITLEALAERSRLSPNYVGSIEIGRRDPSLSTMLALAKGLRVPISDLLGGIEALSPAAIEAGRLFDTAPPDAQDAIARLLRVVARRRR